MLHCGFEGDSTISLKVIRLATQMQIPSYFSDSDTIQFLFLKKENVLGVFETLCSLFVCILVSGKHNKEGKT